MAQINNEQFAKFAVMNDQGTLSERYDLTLKFSQVAESPLTDAEKKKLDRLRSLLTTTTTKTDLITGDTVQVVGPSPIVQLYNEKLGAYEAAALDYNSHRIDALAADDARSVNFWAINANILRHRVKAAMDDWITNGYKNDYEEIAAYIAQVEGRDLVLLKAYLDDLEKARLTGIASGSDFFYTSLIPASFAHSLGWSNFRFSASDVQSYSNSRFNASGWEAQAGGGFLGIFVGSGGGHGESSRTSYDSSINSDYCSMSFDICQVPIVRAWYKSSYLTSPIWRYAVGNALVKNWVLSDGGSPPKGELVAYPTSVIFIRNLNFGFGNSSGFSHLLDQQQSSGAGGGGYLAIGPIFLGGSASTWSKGRQVDRSWECKRTDQGMSVRGMQIIGFKCHVFTKKLPDPAPEIKSWV